MNFLKTTLGIRSLPLDEVSSEALQMHFENLNTAIKSNNNINSSDLTFARDLLLSLQKNFSIVTENSVLTGELLAKTILKLSGYSNVNEYMQGHGSPISWLDFCRVGVNLATQSQDGSYDSQTGLLYAVYQNPYSRKDRMPKYGVFANTDPMADFPVETIQAIWNKLESKEIQGENKKYQRLLSSIADALYNLANCHIFLDKHFVELLKIWPQVPDLSDDLKRCHVAAFMAFANLSVQYNHENQITTSEEPLTFTESLDMFPNETTPSSPDRENSQIVEFMTPRRPIQKEYLTVSPSPRKPLPRLKTENNDFLFDDSTLENTVNKLGRLVETKFEEMNESLQDISNNSDILNTQQKELKSQFENLCLSLKEIKTSIDENVKLEKNVKNEEEEIKKLENQSKLNNDLSDIFTKLDDLLNAVNQQFRSIDFNSEKVASNKIATIESLLADISKSLVESKNTQPMKNELGEKEQAEEIIMETTRQLITPLLESKLTSLNTFLDEQEKNKAELLTKMVSIESSLKSPQSLAEKDTKQIKKLITKMQAHELRIESSELKTKELTNVLEKHRRSTFIRNIVIIAALVGAGSVGFWIGRRKSQ